MQKWIQVGKNAQKSTQVGKNTKKLIQVGEKPRKKKLSTRWNANVFDLANYCFQKFILNLFRFDLRISESLLLIINTNC